eukprot:364238-Chlamydomonas_euryale.AAC.10
MQRSSPGRFKRMDAFEREREEGTSAAPPEGRVQARSQVRAPPPPEPLYSKPASSNRRHRRAAQAWQVRPGFASARRGRGEGRYTWPEAAAAAAAARWILAREAKGQLAHPSPAVQPRQPIPCNHHPGNPPRLRDPAPLIIPLARSPSARPSAGLRAA